MKLQQRSFRLCLCSVEGATEVPQHGNSNRNAKSAKDFHMLASKIAPCISQVVKIKTPFVLELYELKDN